MYFLGLLSCIAGPISRGPTQRGQAIGPLCCVWRRGTRTMGNMGMMTTKRPCASLCCLVQLLHLAGHRCTLCIGLKNENKFALNGVVVALLLVVPPSDWFWCSQPPLHPIRSSQRLKCVSHCPSSHGDRHVLCSLRLPPQGKELEDEDDSPDGPDDTI